MCGARLTTTGLTGVRGPGVSWCVLLQEPVGHQARQQRWMHLALDALQPPSDALLSAHTRVQEARSTVVNLRHVIIQHNIIIIKKTACSPFVHSSSASHLFISQSLVLVVMPSNRFLNSETKEGRKHMILLSEVFFYKSQLTAGP